MSPIQREVATDNLELRIVNFEVTKLLTVALPNNVEFAASAFPLDDKKGF
jgi:hypothetical protein